MMLVTSMMTLRDNKAKEITPTLTSLPFLSPLAPSALFLFGGGGGAGRDGRYLAVGLKCLRVLKKK